MRFRGTVLSQPACLNASKGAATANAIGPHPPSTGARAMWRLLRFAALNQVRVVGEPLPIDTSSTLYLANHRNGAVDAAVYFPIVPHAVALVAAQWHRHALGRWLFAGIPVVRAKERQRGLTGDTSAMIDTAASVLVRRGALLICPEGTSSLGPRHLPYGKGAARIVAHAVTECEQVRVVPLAINYEEPQAWQSRVEVSVGRTMIVDAAMAGDVAAIHALLTNALEATSVEFEDERSQAEIETLAYAATLGRSISYSKALKRLRAHCSADLLTHWSRLREMAVALRGRLHQGVPLVPVGSRLSYGLLWLLFAPVIGLAALANFPVILAARYGAKHFPDGPNVIALWRLLVGVPTALAWSVIVIALLCVLGVPVVAGCYVAASLLAVRCWYRFQKLSVALWNSVTCATLKPGLLQLHRDLREVSLD